jgi:predicted KAP-like P-loop ATPase
MFLNDQETAVDLLYYEAIALTVVKLVRANVATPLTIGIHGDWGAGKSSVLMMVQETLNKQPNVFCLRFNGWQFQGYEDAKAVLIETVITELREARPQLAKHKEKIVGLLKRVDWFKALRKAGPYGVTLATGVPFPAMLSLLTDLKGLASHFRDKTSADDVKTFIEEAGGLLKEAEDRKLPDEIRAFHKEFAELLKAAEVEQLVVLVDDLDRCLPTTAIETLEAIRLFLFAPGTAFIIGADEAMIEYAVRHHFPDLPLTGSALPYARSYLEKLIQVPFRLPALGFSETRIYVAMTLAQAALGEKSDAFGKLLGKARECLSKPWKGEEFSLGALEKVLGQVPQPVQQAIQLTDQISRLLADGTKGNPRQVKRFLNALLLREAIADARGFGAEIKRPVLAKLMLAERFSDTFFDELAKLATQAKDGKPRVLAALEKVSHQEKETKKRKDDEEELPEADRAILEGWQKSEWVKIWAAIPPLLRDEDLRPYMFVTRDKRAYFGGVAGAGHLESLVDLLMRPGLALKGVEVQIANLNAVETEQVFDALRTRIVQSDDLQERPAGFDGLLLIAKSRPEFQLKVVGLLESLAVRKLGAWVLTGLSQSLTDAKARTQHQEWVKKLAEQNENPSLRNAAAALGKVPGLRK